VDVGPFEALRGDEADGDGAGDGKVEEFGDDGGGNDPEDACADAEKEGKEHGEAEDFGGDADEVFEHEFLADEEACAEGGEGEPDGRGEHEQGHHDAGVPETFRGDIENTIDVPGEGPAAGQKDESRGAKDGEHGGADAGDFIVVALGVGHGDVTSKTAGENGGDEGCEHHDGVEHGQEAILFGGDPLEEVLLQPDEHGDAQQPCDQRTSGVHDHQPLANLDL